MRDDLCGPAIALNHHRTGRFSNNGAYQLANMAGWKPNHLNDFNHQKIVSDLVFLEHFAILIYFTPPFACITRNSKVLTLAAIDGDVTCANDGCDGSQLMQNFVSQKSMGKPDRSPEALKDLADRLLKVKQDGKLGCVCEDVL